MIFRQEEYLGAEGGGTEMGSKVCHHKPIAFYLVQMRDSCLQSQIHVFGFSPLKSYVWHHLPHSESLVVFCADEP